MDWDDLRFVLAVVRSGSALGAAKALGVNQTTVTRRVAQLEAHMGAALFVRDAAGYAPTPLGLRTAEAAEAMERHVEDLTLQASADQRELSGVVRFTTTELAANLLMGPCLAKFRREHPNVRLELITSDQRLDLARGEADIALRPGVRPDVAGIVCRRLPDSAWAVYCSTAYADERGRPAGKADLAAHDIIGAEGLIAEAPALIWLEQAAPAQVRLRSNSLTNLVACLQAGLGLSVLPCILGDRDAALVRCFGPVVASESWLIVREDVKASPPVRALADAVFRFMASQRAAIEGTADTETAAR